MQGLQDFTVWRAGTRFFIIVTDVQIMHTLLGRSGGMRAQKNFEKIVALRLNLVGFGS